MTKNEKIIKIKNRYETKEETQFDELVRLDKRVKRPALVFTYIWGILGALVLGFGMCVSMKVILAELMWVGITVGTAGIFMVVVNYFIYKKILESRSVKYSGRILSLSSQLMNE